MLAYRMYFVVATLLFQLHVRAKHMVPPNLNLTLAHSRLAFISVAFIQKLACCSNVCNNTERTCTPKSSVFSRHAVSYFLACSSRVFYIRTYNMRENMHANQREARPYVATHVKLLACFPGVYNTRENMAFMHASAKLHIRYESKKR